MRVEAVQGDITEQAVDVVVNAANRSLLGGGGVDGAIHTAAGPGLLAACRELRASRYPDGLPVGHAVATDAFDLPARWVIHTVGPNWGAGERDPGMLTACYLSALAVAVDLGARTIAFPAISAGAYGWDVDEAAQLAVGALRSWQSGTFQDRDADGTPHGIVLARFVLFSPRVRTAFEHALAA